MSIKINIELLELVKQYKIDAQTRIEILENGFSKRLDLCDKGVCEFTEESQQDYDEQIAHWQATLQQINEVLESEKTTS